MDSLGKLVASLLTSAQGDAAKTDRQEAAHNQDPWIGDLRYAAAAVMVWGHGDNLSQCPLPSPWKKRLLLMLSQFRI